MGLHKFECGILVMDAGATGVHLAPAARADAKVISKGALQVGLLALMLLDARV